MKKGFFLSLFGSNSISLQKFIFCLSFLLCCLSAGAQVKTHSNYDVNGDGEVTVNDVTTTVNKLLNISVKETTVVDGESLNALLLRIEARLKAIEEKLGITSKSDEPEDPYNGHEYVDLGLSVKWATTNVGASTPEDYGLYFAWGETTGYGQDTNDDHIFNWAHYKWCNGSGSTMTKYNDSIDFGTIDNMTTLDSEDDAAHVNWGGDWRMPTKEEQDELQTKCTWKWVSRNGVYGREVTGPNGNTIFLPAAGYRYFGNLGDAGSDGYYWSSSLYYTGNTDYAFRLSFYSSEVGWRNYAIRYVAHSVRAVCP